MDLVCVESLSKGLSLINESFTGISWLERLLDRPAYQNDDEYITKLVMNYRSHPAILKISNRFFYGNTLQAKAPEHTVNKYIRTNILLSKDFPIIFDSKRGYCGKRDLQTSLFNQLEISSVIAYVQRLLISPDLPKISQNAIGIVTPYKLQTKMLQKECKKQGWDEIEIGSVDTFQGKEKPVIIVTTVRSRMKSVGFLDNPKVGPRSLNAYHEHSR